MRAVSIAALMVLAACGSGAGKTPPAPACDADCQDQNALRAIREVIKLAFNLTLQGQPVGAHEMTVPCPLGGTAHVSGTATSNATQGTTEVDVTYDFAACHYIQKDDMAAQNYDVTLSGSFHETGILAVQPTGNTVITIASDSFQWDGTVYSPAIAYHDAACPLMVGQDGNHIAGSMCGRTVGLDL